MNELIDLWERPSSARYMIAGWYQWADAGEVSSGLPRYLVDRMEARKIGRMKPDGFYLFQVPGTHDLLRPVVRLEEGHREELSERRNDFFCSGDGEDGLLIFIGEEPHLNEERYAEAFLDAIERLEVDRVAIVAGVNGPMPYDKEREISCVYSLPQMQEELSDYTVKLSNYEGGATIGVYLADAAEQRGIELLVFYAMVPAYDFSQASSNIQRVSAEEDYKAWHDLMTRLDYMFELDMDLSDLRRRSEELISAWDAKIAQLEEKMPQLVRAYMDRVNQEFTERSFDPLNRAWEEALGDLFEES